MFTVECFFFPDGITPNSGLTGPNDTYMYICIYIMHICILGKTFKFSYESLLYFKNLKCHKSVIMNYYRCSVSFVKWYMNLCGLFNAKTIFFEGQ